MLFLTDICIHLEIHSVSVVLSLEKENCFGVDFEMKEGTYKMVLSVKRGKMLCKLVKKLSDAKKPSNY